jgi:hypothetical protein
VRKVCTVCSMHAVQASAHDASPFQKFTFQLPPCSSSTCQCTAIGVIPIHASCGFGAKTKKPATILLEESAGYGGLVGYDCARSAFTSASSALAAASWVANV